MTKRKFSDIISPAEDVFVFGSNLKGMHGGGAAYTAMMEYGAVWGTGVGRQGDSYAIPTKASYRKSLQLDEIRSYVDSFITYANDHPDVTFFVTRIGCGLAGFTDDEIGPMFSHAPSNCVLPSVWRRFVV